MRVIAGSAKGRQLVCLKGEHTRPTTDRVKENLFNILTPYVSGAQVLDLFAGTGALGIEALSRGAAHCLFVEKDAAAARIVQQNLAAARVEDRSTLRRADALQVLRGGGQYDLILLDPPYPLGLIPKILEEISRNDLLRQDGIIAAENEGPLPEMAGSLRRVDERRYGRVWLSFYKTTE